MPVSKTVAVFLGVRGVVSSSLRRVKITSVGTSLAAALIAASLWLAPQPAAADDPDFLSVSIGWYDMNRQVDEAASFRAEYRSDYKLWVFKPFVGLMGTTDSAFYGFGGFLVDIYFGRRIVLTPSLAAGYYKNGNGRDLGHEIEFRSSVELSYRFDDRSRLGLSFYHLSNASIGDSNPGTEVLGLVYSIPLGEGK